jgi:arsenical pump membrane protein
VASNVANNLPAALFTRSVFGQAGASSADVAAALVGLDVGPNVFVFASLATMLVLDVARRSGTTLAGRELVLVGLRVTPVAVVAAAAMVGARALVFR